MTDISARSVIILLLLSGLTCGLSACDRQSASKEQPGVAATNDSAAATNNSAAEITSGEVTSGEVQSDSKDGAAKAAPKSTIDRSKAGTAAPTFAFAGPGGKDATLQDFAGKPILVNLWATWCTPCVAEMPALDAIAGNYAAKGLQVVTISQDSQGAARVDPFFAKRKFKHLKAWLDPENQFGFHYATGMLPTSVLYNANGKEVARVVGAMDWEGAEGQKLIAEALAKG